MIIQLVTGVATMQRRLESSYSDYDVRDKHIYT